MFKKNKNETTVQKKCSDNASWWVKIRNEPYLLEHPKMMVLSIVCGALLQYLVSVIVFFAAAYFMSALIWAFKVV